MPLSVGIFILNISQHKSISSIRPLPSPSVPGVIMSGGEMVSAYVPDAGVQEHLKEQKDMPIWKLRFVVKSVVSSARKLTVASVTRPTCQIANFLVRYTSNGSTLYSGCEDGVLRRYRRYPDHHHYLGSVFTHKGDIQDLDISPYDECILFTKNVDSYCFFVILFFLLP